MTHLSEEDLTLLYYGELNEAESRSARAHLESCATCRAEQDALQRIFAMVNACEAPDPGETFEADVWRRLRPGLRATRETPPISMAERVRNWLMPSRGMALAGAAAALVLVAFVIGRYSQPGHPAGPPAPAPQAAFHADAGERVLLTALGDHFERSEAVLVDLTTLPNNTSGAVDISSEQRRAHDLLAATRIYRRAATEAGDRTVRDVLEALERVLVEVDVSPSQLSAYELRSLQDRIDEQALLFKMRVASAGVREREQSTRPAAARRSAGA
jgi:hypothetical protein